MIKTIVKDAIPHIVVFAIIFVCVAQAMYTIAGM